MSTSLGVPSDILVKSFPVDGLTTLRTRKGWGEFDELGDYSEEWGSVLDKGSRGALDPLSIDEKAGVDGDLTLEGFVVELGSENGWHDEKGGEEDGERTKNGRKINLYPDGIGGQVAREVAPNSTPAFTRKLVGIQRRNND